MTMLPGTIAAKLASPERYPPAEVKRQAQRILEISPLLRFLLDTVPDVLLVLNSARQVVFANRKMVELFGGVETPVLGLRPGEIIDCVHAFEGLGCGTTECCGACGAMAAFLASRTTVQSNVQEFRVTRRETGEALDLRVQATPLRLGQDEFTIFVMVDISDEKRRRALEHIFFHDILNTVTAMRASADIIGRLRTDDFNDLSTLTTMQSRLVERLMEEIIAQRQLLEAENNELTVQARPIDATLLVREIAEQSGRSDAGRDRTVFVDVPATALSFVSDPVLLRRVLGNMIKNALEACQPGEQITFGCAERDDGLEFWVHNAAGMPRAVQLQVFQRSFSTKGTGRGLGTYSMKLLSERYLNGRIGFTTSPSEGTTFRAWYPMHLAPS
ncbi:MAG TPA: PAS domain-containing sensor histidine kinase [Anaerolineae bacterium]